jgi:hypothetical protein
MTHSDNLDIWPATFDLLNNIFNKIEINICTNNKQLFTTKINNANIKTIYEYNDSQTYPERIANILEILTDKYVITFRDNDWLINADENKLLELINNVDKYNIDRLALFAPQEPKCTKNNIININTTEYIKPIPDNDYYHHSVMPSLWNRISLLELCKEFKNFNYQVFEVSPIIQEYVKHNLKVYNTHSYNSKNYAWNLDLIPYFEFIHLFYMGTWYRDQNFAYGSLKEHFYGLISKYEINIYKSRSINKNHK